MMRLKGAYGPVSNGHEMKWTTYSVAPDALNIPSLYVSAQPLIIWSTVGVDQNGVSYYTFPTSGVGQNQCIGTIYNSLYVDLSFRVASLLTSNELYDCVRVLVIKGKQQGISYTQLLFSNILCNPADVLSAVDTKKWEVIYDKNHTATFPTKSSFGPGYGYFYQPVLPRNHCIRIPLQQTVNLNSLSVLTGNVFEYPIFVIAFAITRDSRIYYTKATMFFKDP